MENNLGLLLAYRDYVLKDLPPKIRAIYERIQQAIEENNNVELIVRRWKKYEEKIEPNTVGAHIRSALIQHHFWDDEFVECHPSYLNPSCTRKIVNCQRVHGIYDFTLVRDGDNPAIIYLDEDNGIFDGFNLKEKQLLTALGCSEVYLVSFKSSTGKYIKIYPYSIPVDEVRTRSSNIVTNDYNYGHAFLGLMVLILIIILFYWLVFRNSGEIKPTPTEASFSPTEVGFTSVDSTGVNNVF